MTRMEEYEALMQELETEPTALEGTVFRAEQRRRTARRHWKLFGIPAGSLAACFAAFVLLVNLFPPFAYACGQIPTLKALAQAVAWSPSLSAAVENEYVQPIEMTKTDGEMTATVHYVIVDRKQLNIFYTLEYPKELEETLQVYYDFGEIDGWGGTSGTGLLTSGELKQIELDFVERDVPENLALTLSVYQTGRGKEPLASEEGVLFDDAKPNTTLLTEFCFALQFDPYFTEQGTTLKPGTPVDLDGQRFTLSEVELYPTHLRLSLEDDPDNTRWLKGLDLYLENERGEQFRKTVNGIVASGDSDGEGMRTFWLDSPFFRDSEHLTLYVEKAQWKEKEARRIRVNLSEGTCSQLPPDTVFGSAERENQEWRLHFIHPYNEDGGMYGVFARRFWDEAGTEYEFNSKTSTFGYREPITGERVEEETYFTESFALQGYHEDTVYLEATFDRVTAFEEPACIPIR